VKNRLLIARRFIGTLVVMALVLFVSGCNQSDEKLLDSSEEYNTIEWTQLIPQDDLEALLNQPDFLSAIEDGSAEDQLNSEIKSDIGDTPESAYQRALVSANVVPDFDSQNIRLPGFIVPLEFDEDFVVTEFFLVPYFGACLHSPPPPPNQIVYVKHSEGIKLESLEQPFWISGLLTTVGEVNDTAHAAYSMTAKGIELYEVSYQ